MLKEILPGPELSVQCFRPLESRQRGPCQNHLAWKDQSGCLGNIGVFQDMKQRSLASGCLGGRNANMAIRRVLQYDTGNLVVYHRAVYHWHGKISFAPQVDLFGIHSFLRGDCLYRGKNIVDPQRAFGVAHKLCITVEQIAFVR